MGKISHFIKPKKSKKHKKIKFVDPFYKGERNNQSNQKLLKNKNEAPRNDDDQEIPRKVRYFMDNKEKLMESKKERPKKNKQIKDAYLHMLPGQTRPLAPTPKFIQGKKEKERAFLNRVENATRKVILQSKISDHYGMKMEDVENGDFEKKKKMSNSRKEKLKHKKEKLKQKKREREVDKDVFSLLKDDVEFGETVSAPPVLTVIPRKAVKNEQFSKPGKRSLLLKEIITANSIQSPNASIQTNQRQLGQTTKRKNLSMAKQRVMDAERQKAIDLYRMMKDKKVKIS